MIKQGLILIFVLQSFFGCSQTTHEKTMKATADKLLDFLSKNDTISIVNLHLYDEEDLPTEEKYKEELARLLEDCKKYQKITRIYGVPKQNSFVIKEGFNGGKKLEIPLFDKRDTTLNWDSCKIVIQFFPQSIQSAKRFYDYKFDTGSASQKVGTTVPNTLPLPPGTKKN